eukprot:14843430-Alexandrium_andersonii.AAC.1
MDAPSPSLRNPTSVGAMFSTAVFLQVDLGRRFASLRRRLAKAGSRGTRRPMGGNWAGARVSLSLLRHVCPWGGRPLCCGEAKERGQPPCGRDCSELSIARLPTSTCCVSYDFAQLGYPSGRTPKPRARSQARRAMRSASGSERRVVEVHPPL